MLFFHGGAFVVGDLESEHARCLQYCADGELVVVSVDYRLAPEHPYPAGLMDCYSALRWVQGNAAELRIEPTRIAVAGSSAGGALAVGVSLLARDRSGPSIAMQMLLYPVLDDRMNTASMAEFVDTPVWDSRNNRAMWEQYLGGRPATCYAAPARERDLAGLPLTYLLTTEFDPLRDDALAFGSRLLASGVSTEIHQLAGTYHGFDQLVPDAAISRRALADQVAFLRYALRD